MIAAVMEWLTCFLNKLWYMPDGIGALIGSMVGLLALMLATLYNAKKERDRLNAQRDTERSTLSAGLRAEIKTFEDLAQRTIDQLTEAHVDEFLLSAASKIPRRRIWESNLSELGILDEHLVNEIGNFYFKLDDLEIALADTAKFYAAEFETNTEKERQKIKESVLNEWSGVVKEANRISDLVDDTK